MNRFNLVMTILIGAVIIFFGMGIFQKVNHEVAIGDTVGVSYAMVSDGETYDMSAVSVIIGENTNDIFTDDKLLGLKVGNDLEFELELEEDVAIDSTGENFLTKGTTVKVEANVTSITPKVEVESEVTSEDASEEVSETASETVSE